MQFKVLGSGSSGNCYLLEDNNECLIIETGLPYKTVLKALNYNISKVVGVIVSHEHGDHIKYYKDFVKYGIPVYVGLKPDKDFQGLQIMQPKKAYKVGNFTIQSFDLVHDVPCVGYYIKHRDMGKALYITDTELVKQDFSKLQVNHIFVEANYSKDLIDRGKPNWEHVLLGHLELNTTCNFIKHNDSNELMNVVLLHLSNANADDDMFISKAKENVHNGVNVSIANSGSVVNVGLIPFLD